VALGVGVRARLRRALAGAVVVHFWADRGECGGEVLKGPLFALYPRVRLEWRKIPPS